VRNQYLERYKGLIIEKVNIFPRSGENLSNLTLLNIDIPDNSFSRVKGNLKASFGVDGNVVKSVSFGYELQGSRESIIASRRIAVGEEINSFNTVKENIKIKYNFRSQITSKELGKFMAKVSINKGTPILSNRIKKIFDVKKDTRVKANLKEGSVSIEFSLTAKENGYVGDTIKLINQNEKIFIGKIIGKNQVLID
jgi:flagellar basal body P-ring formation protein FlgA